MADTTNLLDFKEIRDCLITDECSLTRQIATWQIDDLRLFGTTVEQLVAAEDARVSATYSDSPEDYSGWWLRDIVTRQLRQSFVAACLDAAVYNLNHVCRDVATILDQCCPDLDRDSVKRARCFLVKAGFSNPAPRQWDEIVDLYKFRNTVVHCMAITSDEEVRKEFGRLLRHAPGITVRSGSFDLSAEFTHYFHEKVRDLFDSLHREVVAMCRRLATQRGNPAGGQ